MKYISNSLPISFIAMLVTTLWSMPAISESYLSALLDHNHCGEKISCAPRPTNMSAVVAEGPKISLAVLGADFALSDCTKAFFKRPIEETIHLCEGFLNSGKGTVRDRATAMFTLGHAYTRTRDAFANGGNANESKSIQIWKKAVVLDPTYIEPLISIGNNLGISGDNEGAQAAFDEANRIDPKDWRVYTGRANAYFYAHSASAALAAAEQAVAIKSDEPVVRMAHGRMLLMNERYEEAAKEYASAAIGYKSSMLASMELLQDEHPLLSLADIYKKMGKPALAAGTLSKYIDSLPPSVGNYFLYQNRAEYYELAGIYGKAADDLKEAALRAPPELAEEFAARRAMLLAMAGAKSEAGEELRSVLARGNLKSTLKIQVFLRNQGYTDVTINGHYDEPTKRALDTCLLDKACAPGVGQAI